jgi:H+/Cl- antiporter ClcA
MPKRLHDSLSGMKAAFQSKQHLAILPPAILIGILGGYGAVLFRFAIQNFQFLFYGHSEDILTFAHGLSAWVVIGMPALGGLIVGLLVKYGAPEAKGHGVPEVMEAVLLRGDASANGWPSSKSSPRPCASALEVPSAGKAP